MSTVLLANNNTKPREDLAEVLKNMGHHVAVVDSAGAALRLMESERADLLLYCPRMPEPDARSFLEEVRSRHPGTPVIILAGALEVEAAVALIKAGAFDCLCRPFGVDAFKTAVAGALKLYSVHRVRRPRR